LFQTQNKKLGIFSLAFFISIFFSSCEDKSYFTKVYNKELYKKPLLCLNLEITPYNNEIFVFTKSLYQFDSNCPTLLQIRYKTQIGCNSPYKTGDFSSFVELNLVENNKTYFTIYKDFKDEDIKDEIKSGFTYLQKQINLNETK
jgi:hypothetical protein